MRLKEDMISFISTTIVDDLLKNGLIEVDCPKEKIIDSVGKIIIDELMQEDKLNDEVKELLKSHETELDKGNIDYRRMFQMVKQKLARERGMVL
ncbi:MAG: DUF507 family protein [Nitrospinae bacterium]|nr:DUF507 family protein [Nitrospinota bacterium]MBI5749055.1 DUF507 family protein [Nitrospinota bacterium]